MFLSIHLHYRKI